MTLLSGLTVVERGTDLAGSWCARQFAIWGADVLATPDAPSDDYVSHGKRRVEQREADELLQAADVLVTTRLPDDAHDRLVVVCVTPFGLDGPYAHLHGGDLVVQALSGYMAQNGAAGMPPLPAPGNIVAFACGVSAFVGALAALRERSLSGRGQVVDASCLQAVACLPPVLVPQYTGWDPVRDSGPITGVRVFECRDGYISLSPALTWRSVLDGLLLCGIDVPPDLEEPRPTEHALAGERIAPYVQLVGATELFEAMLLVDPRMAIYPPVAELEDVPRHPQLVARHYDVREARPAKITTTAAFGGGMGGRFDPPHLNRAGSGKTRKPKADAEPPLSGVRIVDLTQAWLGPFATMLLADLGADVIKVESHTRPDAWRFWHTASRPVNAREGAHPGNVHFYFNSANRNKRDLCLDLKTDRGRTLLLELVSRADLVMENFSAGTLERFGIGYDVLREAKPDIAFVSWSGYGGDGPWSQYIANGVSIEAICGWDARHRYPGGPPIHMGFYQADPLCGLHMAALAIAALRHRDLTGESVRVDGSMIEAATTYVGDQILGGTRDAACVLRCAGDDAWIAVERASVEGRYGREARDVMDELQRDGIAAGVVQTMSQALRDPHLVARGFWQPMTHPDLGTHLYAGFPWRFSRSTLEARIPPPRLGEHSREVLRDELGLSQDAIGELVAQGVTGWVFD